MAGVDGQLYPGTWYWGGALGDAQEAKELGEALAWLTLRIMVVANQGRGLMPRTLSLSDCAGTVGQQINCSRLFVLVGSHEFSLSPRDSLREADPFTLMRGTCGTAVKLLDVHRTLQ